VNPQNLKPFQPGHDPRRNVKGTVKTFKQLRALIVEIMNEPVKGDGSLTRAQKLILDMAKSGNPSNHALLLKYGFGNVPDEVKVSGKIKYVVKLKDDDTND